MLKLIDWQALKAQALVFVKVNTLPLIVGFIVGAVVL